MERFICIHGHFYQPPRENAWLEYVERQDSAYPYHDWNERVTEESYAPNAASRIMDNACNVRQIVNNYSFLSFDFGPTLLSWLEENDPETYRSILGADRDSVSAFSGHGSGLAHPYNHMIMPLANRRDKLTQVLWGMQDFEHRFGRRPEGMWLPETAVDLETLEIAAEHSITFAILSQRQAHRFRRTGEKSWTELAVRPIDPTMPYRITLPSGRIFNLFFYDDGIAQGVAFGNLLENGETFARRLEAGFRGEPRPQLVNVATDGETYGHHRRFGDMALAYAVEYIRRNDLGRMTNYAEYLERFPPTHEVEIRENTSWSCVHGVERWRADCGCNAGRNKAWHQGWRAPLRQAMDWLRDALAPGFEEQAGPMFKDPWAARDDYIRVILDRSPESTRAFFAKHAGREMSDTDRVTALKWLEVQRQAMLMYTSCGWYFDDLYGIETLQVIQYAARAVQLARELSADGANIEAGYLARLEKAKSNIPEQGNGRQVFDRHIRPSEIDLKRVAAHFAVSSLLDGEKDRAYCYRIGLDDFRTFGAGPHQAAVGSIRIESTITGESRSFDAGAIQAGEHDIKAAIRKNPDLEAYLSLVARLSRLGPKDLPDKGIPLLEEYFGRLDLSVASLLGDRQRQVMDGILESALARVEATFQKVYGQSYLPMSFLWELGNPIPVALELGASFALGASFRRALKSETLDRQRITSLIGEMRAWGVLPDSEGLSYLFQRRLEAMTRQLAESPADIQKLDALLQAADLLVSLPFQVNLWRVQDYYHRILTTFYPGLARKAVAGDTAAREWANRFSSLGDKIWMPCPPIG